MTKEDKIEKILWSIAFPGFGQILNGHLIKGFVLLGLEFLINVHSNLNLAIISSFQGNIQMAVSKTNYEWLMFYPCIYVFSIWDAYKNAHGENAPFAFLPFVCAAYLGTIGVIYSSTFKPMGAFLGPIWLSILCLLIGTGLGAIVRFIIIKSSKQ